MLSGPEFLALAYRAPAYGGVMAARLEGQRELEGAPTTQERVRQVEPTRAAMKVDPVLSSVIDFG